MSVRTFARDALRLAAACAALMTTYRSVARVRVVNRRVVADVPNTVAGGLYVDPLDLGVGRPLYTTGGYEPEETAFLRATLKPGMAMVDVGANIGYFTNLAASLVGPLGRVIAIEPEPENLALLSANVRRNGHSAVTICACAVGDRPGESSLQLSDWNKGHHRLRPHNSSGTAIKVPVETVDLLVKSHGLERVDIVKMDVEGYEPAVLAGMTQTVSRDRPIIVTEFWPKGMRDLGFSPEDFLGAVLDAGYVGFPIDTPSSRLRTVADLIALVPTASADAYINLAFVPEQNVDNKGGTASF